jgi:hypothetical protein
MNDIQNVNKLNLNRVKRYTQSDVPHSDLLPRHHIISVSPLQLLTSTPRTIILRTPSNFPCHLNNPGVTLIPFNKNFKDSLVRNSTLFQNILSTLIDKQYCCTLMFKEGGKRCESIVLSRKWNCCTG